MSKRKNINGQPVQKSNSELAKTIESAAENIDDAVVVEPIVIDIPTTIISNGGQELDEHCEPLKDIDTLGKLIETALRTKLYAASETLIDNDGRIAMAFPDGATRLMDIVDKYIRATVEAFHEHSADMSLKEANDIACDSILEMDTLVNEFMKGVESVIDKNLGTPNGETSMVYVSDATKSESVFDKVIRETEEFIMNTRDNIVEAVIRSINADKALSGLFLGYSAAKEAVINACKAHYDWFNKQITIDNAGDIFKDASDLVSKLRDPVKQEHEIGELKAIAVYNKVLNRPSVVSSPIKNLSSASNKVVEDIYGTWPITTICTEKELDDIESEFQAYVSTADGSVSEDDMKEKLLNIILDVVAPRFNLFRYNKSNPCYNTVYGIPMKTLMETHGGEYNRMQLNEIISRLHRRNAL